MSLMNLYHVSPTQFQQRLRTFVPIESPFYFREERLADRLLQQGVLVYTRDEFLANFPGFGLTYGGEFQIWDVAADFTFVAFLDDRQLQSFDEDVQNALLRSQCVCGRGHVYAADWIWQLNERFPEQRTEWEQVLAKKAVWVEERQSVVLTAGLWNDLSDAARISWLSLWLEEKALDEPTAIPLVDVPFQDLSPLTRDRLELLQAYNGRFADESGANCFATALALALGHRTHSPAIIGRWLHPKPFLRSLQAIGYQKVDQLTLANRNRYDFQAEDVLVWVSQEGQLIHATYSLGQQYLFNKMGQNWYHPWQIIHLDEIYDYGQVLSQGGTIDVYRKRG